MKQYQNLLQSILDKGVKTGDRTGTGNLTIPGHHYQVEMDQDEDGIIHNFPLLTTKFVSLKSVFEELMWKLRGDTNIRYLIQHNNHIWTEWPFKHWLQKTGQQGIIDRMWKDQEKSDYSEEWKEKKKQFEEQILSDDLFNEKWGGLGRTYGHHYRNFGEVLFDDLSPELRKALFFGIDGDLPKVIIPGKDQLMDTIDLINSNPENRRIIINLWNAQDTAKTLLPPCPCFEQFFANEPGYLHLNMYQRSCDTFLGVPYNTAQEALLLVLMAHITGRKARGFNHFFGDAHIYLNHIDQVKEQLSREPRKLPKIRIKRQVENILDFKWEDIELIDYNPHKGIRGAVSI